MTTLCFLLGTVFVVGRVVWLMTMYEARAHRQMVAGIRHYYEARSRAPGGSDVAPVGRVPQPPSRATQGTGGEPPAVTVEAPPVPSQSWWARGPHPAPTRLPVSYPIHAPAGAGATPPTSPAPVGLHTSVGGAKTPAASPTGPYLAPRDLAWTSVTEDG